MLEVVHSEVFDVIEIGLWTAFLSKVAQSVQAPWKVAGVLTVEILFQGLLMLNVGRVNSANRQGIVDTVFLSVFVHEHS